MSYVPRSNNALIDGVLWGVKWDSLNLTYNFPTTVAEYGGYAAINGYEPFTIGQANSAIYCINLVNSYCGLNITPSTGGVANFRFAEATTLQYGNGDNLHQPGFTAPGAPRSSAEGNPPDPAQSPAFAQGDMWFNHTTYNTPLLGTFAFAAGIAHEFGHALGLKHGMSAQTTNNVQYPALQADMDSQEFSVMTYRTYPGANIDTQGFTNMYPQTFMMADIAALQYLYGADYTSNSGNSIYTFNPFNGEMSINGAAQGAPNQNYIFRTVWDGGGNDTYDLSNYFTNLILDLNPGSWSTLAPGQLANLGDGRIARGSVANALLFNNDTRSLIENAVGGAGADSLIGNQVANTLAGNDGNDALDGRDGDDALAGGAGNDAIAGGNGNDTLNGGSGADLMAGNAGNDVYLVDNAGDVVQEQLNEGLDQIFTSTSYTLSANVEWLIVMDGFIANGVGNGLNNAILGNSYANALDGGLGNDNISGGGGDDQIFGGGGNDVMAGGTGNDTFYADSTADQVIESANEGLDIVVSSASFTLGANVEWLVLQEGGGAINGTGNADNNAISGNNYANVLNGGDGGDVLVGNSGDDSLIGGLGVDAMYGGDGNDFCFVDNSQDIVIEYIGQGTIDTVYSTAHYILLDNVENLILQGNVALNAIGNAQANGIVGNSATNILNGGGGVDALIGGGGNDVFQFNRGQANGDTILDFTGNGAGAGDVIQFIGYGPGAAFGQLDATHWIVISGDGLTSEIITIANGAAIHVTDWVFS